MKITINFMIDLTEASGGLFTVFYFYPDGERITLSSRSKPALRVSGSPIRFDG
jgi:hypothetical protein